jgi:hypothetical protein
MMAQPTCALKDDADWTTAGRPALSEDDNEKFAIMDRTYGTSLLRRRMDFFISC